MNELDAAATRIREIGAQRPSPERFSEAVAALRSKWEGVQSVALDALGNWGGADSVAHLRAFLQQAYERKHGWAIRGVAIEALSRCVNPEDVPWILDLYFGVEGVTNKHELVRLVITLPPEVARKRLVTELRSANPHNRQAAVKAIGNMAFPDKRAMLWPLRDDPDDFVRKSARLLSEV